MATHNATGRLIAASAQLGSAASRHGVGLAVETDTALALQPGGQAEQALLLLPELPLLVQAIVEPVGTTVHGPIIQPIAPVWRGLVRLLATNPHAIRELEPRQLEELVAACYDEEGFDEVILTPRSGDHGRDVIATKRGMYTVRIVDQVKHFAPNHRVTANDVRALAFVALADERATHGFVTTTSSFAPGIESDPFLSKYLGSRLELVDGQHLMRRLLGYAK
jgi:restriction system protein